MHRPAMLATLVVLGILATPAAAHSSSLSAWFMRNQNHRWCAEHPDSIRDCSFDTLAQCRATISGLNGLCQPNLFYSGPPPKPRRSVRARRS